MAIMKELRDEQVKFGAGLAAEALKESGVIAGNGSLSRFLDGEKVAALGKGAAALLAGAGPIGWIAAGAIGAYLIWDALDC